MLLKSNFDINVINVGYHRHQGSTNRHKGHESNIAGIKDI